MPAPSDPDHSAATSAPEKPLRRRRRARRCPPLTPEGGPAAAAPPGEPREWARDCALLRGHGVLSWNRSLLHPSSGLHPAFLHPVFHPCIAVSDAGAQPAGALYAEAVPNAPPGERSHDFLHRWLGPYALRQARG